jgi:hypothetical protein
MAKYAGSGANGPCYAYKCVCQCSPPLGKEGCTLCKYYYTILHSLMNNNNKASIECRMLASANC